MNNFQTKKTYFMKAIIVVSILTILSFISCKTSNPVVEIRTEFGNIKLEIYADKAPISAENFLRYVDKNLYENSSFYRTVTMSNQPNNKIKIEVIQGGLGDNENKMLPPVAHEPTNKTGILHKDGVISFARNEPGSETSEFFICIGDQPELDYGGRRNPDGQGFSAFGKVIEGMNVVMKIHSSPNKEQSLNPPIKIFNVVILN